MSDQESKQMSLSAALARLDKAVDALGAAVEHRFERDLDHADAEEEVQRLNEDRARLAQELDQSESRSERVTEANNEVSRRLVVAMETIRAVLDR